MQPKVTWKLFVLCSWALFLGERQENSVDNQKNGNYIAEGKAYTKQYKAK